MSLYHEAAEILLAPQNEGGSLKNRIFRKNGLKSPPSQLYALVVETCKWSAVLKEVVEAAGLLSRERKLTPALSLLLVHDFLLSKGGIALPQSHGLRASIERHRARLASELTRARLRRKARSMEMLKARVDRDCTGEEATYPRWVRVNALKGTLEGQLEITFAKYERATSIADVVAVPGAKRLYIDPHVPNLVAVTPGVDLTKSDAYAAGKIILQDKASCFPAYLLDPRVEDGDVVDACAAPGNKTTHLAAILHEHAPEYDTPAQTIFAFEKDSRRALTLEKMVKTAGSKSATRIGLGLDFLRQDPGAQQFANVGALLLDPSCSGSGIVGRDSMPPLHLPETSPASGAAADKKGKETAARKRKHNEVAASDEDKVLVDDDGNETIVKSEQDLEARLEALSNFQLTLLLHAFRFPSATKITYSTCSVHTQENEGVVKRALASDLAQQRGWRIMTREAQVSGMRKWPVRGIPEACGGDEAVAGGCIRCHKSDGQGVMGFFVAGFVRGREAAKAGGDKDDGPYVRDENGVILRDVMGMPVLKATGEPVALQDCNGEAVGQVEDGSEASGEDVGTEEDDEQVDSDTQDENEEEWTGFGD